jgi:ATP-dependent DNA helicase RecG
MPHETPWLEFKLNHSDVQEIGEYISALANGAMLAGKDRAFMVFGVENRTHAKVGTVVRLNNLKNGGENFINWVSRMIEPRLTLDFRDFESEGLSFAIIEIEPSYDRPVRFAGAEWIRVGENKRRLAEFPERERTLWMATARRRFEDALAMSNLTSEEIFARLDTNAWFELSNHPRPQSDAELIRKLTDAHLLIDNLEGRFDITNLGAILLARNVRDFPSISSKSVRVIKYIGRDKSRSETEQEGARGYAVGFSGLIKYLMDHLPTEEQYINGVRRTINVYPEAAVREVIANALIHQDFMITGAGPVIEIYENRIEVTNTGNSLISPDRMLDERRSRNERLAETMRTLGLCEERGGGLDKTLLEVERRHLPAPDFIASENSFRVVLFGPRPFSEMSKSDRVRACFHHCVLRWLTHDLMSNSTLRERFSLRDEDYQAVSSIIAEAIKLGRIVPADPDQGRRNAKYVPYWAGAAA